MKYMFLMYSPEDAWTPDQWKACVETSMGICQELASKGQLLSAAPLHPVATGETVRVRNGKRIVTDGPFAETSEVLGGYYILLAEDQSAAMAIATQHSGARLGAVEVRQVFELTGAS